MSDNLEDFKKLSELAEKQREEKAKAQGSMENIALSLKERGFKSPADARSKIAVMEKDLAKRRTELEKKIQAFKVKYGKYLQ